MSRLERDVAERFVRETAKHEMTIRHDDGLYRHLRFRRPDNVSYWFDLITWPGALVIRGDINSAYVFNRLPDMFEFFRGERINPHYWAEKLDIDRDIVMEYDQALFERTVKEHVADAILDRTAPRGISRAVKELLASGDTSQEEGARRALEEFEFCTFTATCECGSVETFTDLRAARKPRAGHDLHRRSVERGESFTFEGTWEWSFKDYNWSFLWACHAIVWGIAQYDAKKAAGQPAEQAGAVTR